MSDFLGILVVGNKAVHIVDWSRPAWFYPTNPDGLRVVPDFDHFVADAIAVMYLDVLKSCTEACDRDLAGLNDLAGPQCEHVTAARSRIYSEFSEPLVFVHPDVLPDSFVARDFAKFEQALKVFAKLDSPMFDRNGWSTKEFRR